MKIKVFLSILLLLSLNSCFIPKGKYIGENCRPKNPNFKLLKIPFIGTDKLVFNRIYTKDGKHKIGIGFFNDGRIILIDNFNYEKQNYELITPFLVENKNWKEPKSIGYWRVENDLIKTEYFSCSNSGNYIREQGKINGDTIFFEKECSKTPFKNQICFDKYILSDLNFK